MRGRKILFFIWGTPAETLVIFKTDYRDTALSKTGVYMLIHDDHRRTLDKIVSISGLSWNSIQKCLLEDLSIRRVVAKLVPRLRRDEKREQREHPVQACLELQNKLQAGPEIFSKIMTSDETWCYGYYHNIKQQSSQWKSLHSPRINCSEQWEKTITKVHCCVRINYFEGDRILM